MKFYCIVNTGEDSPTIGLLESACRSRGLDFVRIVAASVDFGQLPSLQKGDILYRDSASSIAHFLERLLWRKDLRSMNAGPVALFGRNTVNAVATTISGNLSTPRTVFAPSSESDVLVSQVEQVGGFPVILKAAGFAHSEGVSKYDSIDSLVQAILSGEREDLMLREFIDFKKHARVIVVGDEVVASLDYKRPEGDFRTNIEGSMDVVPGEFSEEVERLAVDVVGALGLHFGGVDVLIDEDGKPYVAEVNMPCNFYRAKEAADIDVSTKIVDFLVNLEA